MHNLLLIFCTLFFQAGSAADTSQKTTITVNAPSATVSTAPASANTPIPAVQASTPDNKIPVVTDMRIVHNPGHVDSSKVQTGHDTLSVYPNTVIQFTITNAQYFLKSRPDDKARVTLFINGVEMHGIACNWGRSITNLDIQQNRAAVIPQTAYIQIELVRDAVSQKSWNYFYNAVDRIYDYYLDASTVSVGWTNMSPLDVQKDKLPALRIFFFHFWTIFLWAGLFLFIVIGFVILALKTDVIKESPNGAYSLSYTQLLFWTALIMGGFIYIIFFSDITVAFNSSILLLLGISMGTTGAANFIDFHKLKTNKSHIKKPQSFIRDVLTDGETWSVQRVQTFGWNLILGLYFVFYVLDNKTMPEFSPTLLLLAGFSSTAYLASKVPENTASATKTDPGGDTKTTPGQMPPPVDGTKPA